MGYFVIDGLKMPVSGEVVISGAKNAALPIMAASMLCSSAELVRCPVLSDTEAAAKILKTAGFECTRDKTFKIRRISDGKAEIPRELCGAMRSSVLFAAPFLCRFGYVRMCAPGGCRLGARPIDIHLDILAKTGAEITYDNDSITAKADCLKGAEIVLPFPSVGATETAIMAGVCADGRTIIKNPAQEPEIHDLCSFLNFAGADIHCGKEIEINGKNSLLGTAAHRIMPDRIEAGTYLAAAAVTGGELFLKNAVYEHIRPFADILTQMSAAVCQTETGMYIDAPERLYNPDFVETAPYPLFPTDMQPQLTALAAVKCGDCLIKENIFETRFAHIPQLNKMGADIEQKSPREFLVHGINRRLESKTISASDLRCGAALILAALSAKDGAVIQNGDYILRGYEDICQKMSLIGVKMQYCT